MRLGIAPKGEAPDARRARIRKYEDFFFPASLAVPDDVRAMEGAHSGSMARDDGWNDLALGNRTLVDGADAAAQELGVTPINSNPGREVETPFFASGENGSSDFQHEGFNKKEAAELLYREAWYLDNKKWDEWLALYADEAIYWAPAMVGDEGWTDNPDNDVSLMYMDRAGLEARIFRIEGVDHATDPLPHTAHLVTNVLIHEERGEYIDVSASWTVHAYIRVRGGLRRSGRYEYTLRATPAVSKSCKRRFFCSTTRSWGPNRHIQYMTHLLEHLRHQQSLTGSLSRTIEKTRSTKSVS